MPCWQVGVAQQYGRRVGHTTAAAECTVARCYARKIAPRVQRSLYYVVCCVCSERHEERALADWVVVAMLVK
jgi:hypothetical protein